MKPMKFDWNQMCQYKFMVLYTHPDTEIYLGVYVFFFSASSSSDTLVTMRIPGNQVLVSKQLLFSSKRNQGSLKKYCIPELSRENTVWTLGNFLVVQWLELDASPPGWDTNVP